MSKTIINEELREVRIVVPEPLTAVQFLAYRKVYADAIEKGASTDEAAWKSAVSFIESGSYMKDGTKRTIEQEGLSAPLEVLMWMHSAVNDYINGLVEISKNSSAPPSTPPKVTAPSPRS